MTKNYTVSFTLESTFTFDAPEDATLDDLWELAHDYTKTITLDAPSEISIDGDLWSDTTDVSLTSKIKE